VYHEGAPPETIDPEDIDIHVAKHEGVLWVDVTDATHDDFARLAEEFSLNSYAIEDAVHDRERPKVERFDTHAFMVLYDRDIAKVSLFLGSCWVISVHDVNREGHCWDPTNVRKNFPKDGMRLTPGQLVYWIVDDIVDGYEDRSDELSDRVEAVEEQVLDDDPDDRTTIEHSVLQLRRELLVFRRIVIPLRDVLQEIRRGRNDDGRIDPDMDIALGDVHDHVLSVIDQLDAQRELLGNAFDAHLATLSNQMNLVMKKLTAWGSIVFGATLIAGIYGMNFTHMPELDWKFGYPMALGAMLLLSVVLYRMFKKRDWL